MVEQTIRLRLIQFFSILLLKGTLPSVTHVYTMDSAQELQMPIRVYLGCVHVKQDTG